MTGAAAALMVVASAADHRSAAHQALGYAGGGAVCTAISMLAGLRRLEPPREQRYAQGRGVWRAMRVARWIFLGVTAGSLLIYVVVV